MIDARKLLQRGGRPQRPMLFQLLFGLTCCLIGNLPGMAQDTTTAKTEGLHSGPPRLFAITGATIHVSPTTTIEKGTVIVLRDKITLVGPDIAVPAGAQVIDASGKHLYAGWIDSYVPYGESITLPEGGSHYWNDRIRPELSVADLMKPSGIKFDEMKRAGITNALLVPSDGIIQGMASIVHANGESGATAVVRADVAMNSILTASRGFGRGGPATPAPATPGPAIPAPTVQNVSRYPTSPMGAYAVARQAFYDAQWYRNAWQVADRDQNVLRPERNQALDALQPVLDGEMPLLVQTSNEFFALRAARFAKEFGLKYIVVGSGQEYRRVQEVAALKVPIVLPLNFPQPPTVNDTTAVLNTSLESLMHWDIAPENPLRLHEADVSFVFSSQGLSRAGDLLGQVRKAIERGLPSDVALAALTTKPAELWGVDQQLGTVAAGKFANFFLSDKPIFDKSAKITESWVAGNRLQLDTPKSRQFAGLWRIETTLGDQKELYLIVREEPRVSGSLRSQIEASEEKPDISLQSAAIRDTQFSGSFKGDALGVAGSHVLSFVVDQPGVGHGQLVLADGQIVTANVSRVGDAPADSPRSSSVVASGERGGGERGSGERGGGGRGFGRGRRGGGDESAVADANPPAAGEAKSSETNSADAAVAATPQTKATTAAMYPVNFPFGDYGRTEIPVAAKSVLIKNVTVWTSGPQGNLPGGAILFGDGKIISVHAAGEALPDAELVIDGQGGHVTPGLIDCHSHMATDSGVNEGGQAITAEVRIGDFIDARDISIYRQLAGGLTAANILHGSANPIGGQNQVIKLRWGLNDEQLKFAEAPAGIKFALGENVKQSSARQPSNRYPQTRMGVEQIMHDSFRAAQEYAAAHERWQLNRQGLPPRVDLELEAISEIVQGKRWIHCHSYRQDEILALIRVLDQYGIRIGTFQHILEGYKVAEAMAKHGAMASAFSDWWAYKVEVQDAIPYAGSIMHEQGIVVSFNSDDGELARHMNHEAAKAMRFGGVSEEEALKFVTLNPAKQLRIDQYVGSLEPGKHADIVLWNGHPLETTSRCDQTWIDGRKYFDFVEDRALVAEQAKMRAALVQRVLASGESMSRPGEERQDPSLSWPRYDEYCMAQYHRTRMQDCAGCDGCQVCQAAEDDDWACLFGDCQILGHQHNNRVHAHQIKE